MPRPGSTSKATLESCSILHLLVCQNYPCAVAAHPLVLHVQAAAERAALQSLQEFLAERGAPRKYFSSSLCILSALNSMENEAAPRRSPPS